MQVTLLKNWPGTKLTPGHRKEKHFKKQITAFSKDLREVVTVRFYDPGGSKEYCCIWINTRYFPDYPGEDVSYKQGFWAYGSGSASGYGYEHTSAALWNALQSAGINITELSGTGNNLEAVQAICEYFKADISFYHEAHP